MKLHDNILYLEFSDAISSGISLDTLKKASSRNSPSWKFIDDPTDKRKRLIHFEALADSHKNKVLARFGNPYEYLAKEPIRNMIVHDSTAEQFFLSYRYSDNKMLPVEHVKKYTAAASWLNMLIKANADKKQIKKLLQLNIDKFYQHVLEMIVTDKIDLPNNYQSLLRRRNEYEEKGYECLIDWRFGNKNAAKVAGEVSESVLLELLSHPNQYDDVYICARYNDWAVSNDHAPISSATVGVWRRRYEHLIIGRREGRAAQYDKYSKEVKGFRPTQPLYLVESDDNHLDLLYIDVEDKTAHRAYHRYKAIVVTDSFNDYVLGYAYAEKLTTEVVRAAYINAMYHIRELTGSWWLPHEIKTDRWAITELRPFYSGIAHYYDTPVGSKKRGYIEQFFGSPLWKRALKAGANNYTGNNMVAKFRGVNQEELDLNKKDRLTLDEGRLQVENFFNRLRHMPNDTGKSKQQEWLEAFAAMPEDKRRSCTDEQFLLKFGVQHRPKNGRQIAITNGGVEPQIGGTRFTFAVPPALYLPNVGKKVSVIYDPYDMTRVLVTDFSSLRFIATAARQQPRAMADFQPGDRRLLNALLSEKMADNEKIARAAARRKEVLQANDIDAETLLQAGVMVKELRQVAESSYTATIGGSQSVDRASYNPLDQM